MGLSIEKRRLQRIYLFLDRFFRDSNSEFYDSEQGVYYSENVSAKTIFVDPKDSFA